MASILAAYGKPWINWNRKIHCKVCYSWDRKKVTKSSKPTITARNIPIFRTVLTLTFNGLPILYKKLSAYNNSKISMIGKCLFTHEHESELFNASFIVVDTKSVTIFGLEACENQTYQTYL